MARTGWPPPRGLPESRSWPCRPVSEARHRLRNRPRYRPPTGDGPQPCPRHRGSAGRRQARRHRISPVPAAAPSRHRRGRVDHQGGRSDRRLAPSTTSPNGWTRAPSPRQDWVFVKKGETARELWERALAPLGQGAPCRRDLPRQNPWQPAGHAPGEEFATKAPNLSDGKHCSTISPLSVDSSLENRGKCEYLRSRAEPDSPMCLRLQEHFTVLRRTAVWPHCDRIRCVITHISGI